MEVREAHSQSDLRTLYRRNRILITIRLCFFLPQEGFAAPEEVGNNGEYEQDYGDEQDEY